MSNSYERRANSNPMDTIHRIRSSRSEHNLPTITSSTHPWYYVPGKPHLTEQRLSSKHSKESQRYQQNDEFNKYFIKCNSETKLFSNWENSKPLVKYHRRNEWDLISPFYIEDSDKRDQEKILYFKCLSKMRHLFQTYEETASTFKKNFQDCTKTVKCLFEYVEIYKSIKRKRCIIMKEIKHYLVQNSYTSTRDPLRHVCFLIQEILYFYKKEIFHIMKLLKSIFIENFLSEQEQLELEQLNNRCFQIVDMYIQLNEIRNNHFQRMYNEEREKAWSQQKKVWNNEIIIWDNLIIKLLQSDYILIKDKLEATLNQQKAYSQSRIEKFDLLNSYVREIRHDSVLQSVLYQDIEQLYNNSTPSIIEEPL
ncbi:hypothetical protein BLOT_003180 [Blomia tropicalis]|nr:hypothetical protein BLOT_003180 [Blomia tropicalis]